MFICSTWEYSYNLSTTLQRIRNLETDLPWSEHKRQKTEVLSLSNPHTSAALRKGSNTLFRILLPCCGSMPQTQNFCYHFSRCNNMLQSAKIWKLWLRILMLKLKLCQRVRFILSSLVMHTKGVFNQLSQPSNLSTPQSGYYIGYAQRGVRGSN